MERHRDRITAAEKERDDALAELARANRELTQAMDRADAETVAILRAELGLEEG